MFVVFVDDLHLPFTATGWLRQDLKHIVETIQEPGDVLGMTSTGPSAINLESTKDRDRITEALRHVSGAALKPSEIAAGLRPGDGGSEVRYRVHVSFAKLYETLKKLADVNSPKAILCVTSGYDFDPFWRSRPHDASAHVSLLSWVPPDAVSGRHPFEKTSDDITPADLVADLTELIHEARRTKTAIFTLDVVKPESPPAQVDFGAWEDHRRETQASLRVIADSTGGFATGQGDAIDPALTRIAASVR